MTLRLKSVLAATAILVSASTAAYAAPRIAAPAAVEYDKASPVLLKRQALAALNADAAAILSAIERDPTLARQLAANPGEAEAMLRARGATRAEQIVVTPQTDPTGQQLTITITIKLKGITIIITIEI